MMFLPLVCFTFNTRLMKSSKSFLAHAIMQRSGTYGSRATCGSLQDGIWLSGSQTNLSRLSLKYCKTVNSSRRVFQNSHCCFLQLSYSPIGQVSTELEDCAVPCDTNAQIFSCHGSALLDTRSSWLSLPAKKFPTTAIMVYFLSKTY